MGNGRGVFSGGKTTERKKGPDSFPVPCTVTLRLDCDAGALSARVQWHDADYPSRVVLRTEDLGVICSGLPWNARMHLAVSTFGPRTLQQQCICIESYREVTKTVPDKRPAEMVPIRPDSPPTRTQPLPLQRIATRVRIVGELLAEPPSDQTRSSRAEKLA